VRLFCAALTLTGCSHTHWLLSHSLAALTLTGCPHTHWLLSNARERHTCKDEGGAVHCTM